MLRRCGQAGGEKSRIVVGFAAAKQCDCLRRKPDVAHARFDPQQLALLATKYHPQRFAEHRERRQRMANNAAVSSRTEQYDEGDYDDDGYDDGLDYENGPAGNALTWIVAIRPHLWPWRRGLCAAFVRHVTDRERGSHLGATDLQNTAGCVTLSVGSSAKGYSS
jgi:hypothetical protein